MKRENLEFRSGDDTCAAWYYRPVKKVKGKAPCVVMAHGFSLTMEMGLNAFAERFADKGYAVLVFDYRHFGGSSGMPRQLLSINKQLQDWKAAVACARSLEGVDSGRICLWGVSFSGGHVFEIAAADDRIAAVISQVPFISGISLVLANSFVQDLKLTIAGLKDFINSLSGGLYYIPSVGAPGTLSALNAPGIADAVRKLYPAGYTPDERVTAGVFLTMPYYSPGRKIKKMKMPLLMQIAKNDHTNPVKPARRAASKASFCRCLEYDMDHLDLFTGKNFEHVVRDQLEFLNEFVAHGK